MIALNMIAVKNDTNIGLEYFLIEEKKLLVPMGADLSEELTNEINERVFENEELNKKGE
jgi:hypothetical protein